MGRLPALRALILASALGVTAASAQDAGDGEFWVGSLRVDGRAHAVARLAGAEWRAPTTKDALPKRWWFVPLHSAPMPQMQVNRTSEASFKDPCHETPLFQTDGPAAHVEPDACHVEKAGLLVSQQVKLFRSGSPAHDDPIRSTITRIVETKVVVFEGRTAKAEGDLGPSPNAEGCRRKKARTADAAAWPCVEPSVAMQLEEITPPGFKQRVVRVDYKKRGRPNRLNSYECGDTLYQAWLGVSGGRVTVFQENFDLPDCDYKSMQSETPLVGFVYDGRSYLVSMVEGWESHVLTVSELTPKGLVRLADDANYF